MWIIDTWGHFPDGTVRLIFDERTTPEWSGAACMCMTEEEYESGSRVDELKDKALDLCEELADLHPFEWNECQEDYESSPASDSWWIEWSRGDHEHPAGTALGCVGE